MNRLNFYTTILLTLGLVLWLEAIITIEWTYPYCMDLSDGPAYAAYGMPLPYWMYSGASSLVHDFLPHIYILNIIILCLLVFPVLRWILNRFISARFSWLRKVFGAVGFLLIISHIALISLAIHLDWFMPGMSLGIDPYHRYADFRPVRIGMKRSHAAYCTPSEYWFPTKKKNK